nr:flagellin [Halomonas sp. UBA3074]
MEYPTLCAKDDAAGQAIANRMSSQITGLNQASRNANDGISIAQTAEGSLNQINDNLQRIRELTVQAQNGTNSESDLGSIQDEVNQRLNEINRISEETDFNGVKVLSEDISSISIQVGANDGESISVNLRTINQTELSLDGFDLTNTLRGVSAGEDDFTENKVNFGDAAFQADAETVALTEYDALATAIGAVEFSGTDVKGGDTWELQDFDGQRYAVNTTDNKVYTLEDATVSGTDVNVSLGEELTGDLARSGDGRGSSFDFTGGTATSDYSIVKDNADQMYVREVADNGDTTYKALTTTNVEADGNGVVEIDLADTAVVAATASDMSSFTTDPMKQLDKALANVDSLRSELGAVQNRFEDAITNLDTNSTNLSSARSRIEDADYATEVANMTRAQILQQAGTSVLAQANQIPQNVLSLLG